MTCTTIRRSDGVVIIACGPRGQHAAAATPAKCANCASHPEAYHDGVRRALPWLTSSHCRAWVPENPGGKCKCPGFDPMAAAR